MPAGLYCGWSTRQSGYSRDPFAGNNVARHVGDDADVDDNRRLLQSRLSGSPEILWLNQTHSTVVAEQDRIDHRLGQDGVTTIHTGQACCVMTADCLPVFLWSSSGDRIAAVHAGWRGLANGILQQALNRFDSGSCVYAGIGPAISQSHFEVGLEVVEAFGSWTHPERYFAAGKREGKFQCDLPGLAKAQLRQLGVARVYLSQQCTYSDATQFYSYRRDRITGRMANLIWKVT